jgi:hypothetical protein
MLEEQERERTDQQLDRIANALEQLPNRLARAMRHEGIGRNGREGLTQQIMQAQAEARKTAVAKRRANIAIGLTAMTSVASLIAAVATLIHG